jgi:hypothetical protein
MKAEAERDGKNTPPQSSGGSSSGAGACKRGSPTGLLLAVAFEAALLVVGFLSAPGVAHEPEAAGAVDLQAGPGLEEDLEPSTVATCETD